MKRFIRSISFLSLLAVGVISISIAPTADARVYHTGPEGGCYYINSSGNRSYSAHSNCSDHHTNYAPSLTEQKAAYEAAKIKEQARQKAHYDKVQEKKRTQQQFKIKDGSERTNFSQSFTNNLKRKKLQSARIPNTQYKNNYQQPSLRQSTQYSSYRTNPQTTYKKPVQSDISPFMKSLTPLIKQHMAGTLSEEQFKTEIQVLLDA